MLLNSESVAVLIITIGAGIVGLVTYVIGKLWTGQRR